MSLVIWVFYCFCLGFVPIMVVDKNVIDLLFFE